MGLLKTRFPKRTYAFCGYGLASHFPNCFRIPGKDDRATAARRQSYFSNAQVTVIADLLRTNIEACRTRLLEHRSSYDFLIRFRGSDKGIRVVKERASINVEPLRMADDSGRDYDVCFTTRPEYLRNSLTREFGADVLFVGSGGIFEYRERSLARTNLHRQLATMLVRHAPRPDSRSRHNRKWPFRIKRLAKSILGFERKVLYDLERWIVYTESRSPTRMSGSYQYFGTRRV